MARRFVVVAAIVGALLLFVGSLFANPLLKQLGLRSNHKPGLQLSQHTGRQHRDYKPNARWTRHQPAQPELRAAAGAQGADVSDPSQAASDPNPDETTTTPAASGPVGQALTGIKKWWSNRLSDAGQVWAHISHRGGGSAQPSQGAGSTAGAGNGSSAPTSTGTSAGGTSTSGSSGFSFSGAGSGDATTSSASGKVASVSIPTSPGASAAQGGAVGSAGGDGTLAGDSGSVPTMPPGSKPAPVPGAQANRIMIQDMSGRDGPYSWNDSVVLSLATGGLTVHWTDPQGDDLMGRAGHLVQEGMPVAVLYSFPQMESDFTPWGPQFTEDMYLHNGGNDAAHRVRHTQQEMQTIMDVGNPNYANTIAPFLAGLVKDNGLSGLYMDGLHGNLSIKYIWDWIVPPTQDQINSWLSRSRVLYAALKRELGAKLLITSTSDPGANPDLVAADDAIIDLVDGTMMEGWLTGSWGTLNDYGYSVYKTALARATLNNKILWLVNGDDDDTIFRVYGIYLLDASPNLWFSAGGRHLDEMTRDPGQPLGDAVQQDDGTWVREFENVTVRANPSDDSHGGMDSWTSTLTWKN